MRRFLQPRLALLAGLSLILSACDFNLLDVKAKAGLQVETGEIASTLFLDGQYLEKTPFINKDIKPGTYSLKIQPDNADLVASELNVTLRKGLLTVVTWLPGARPELSGGVTYEMEKLDGAKQTELSIVTIPDAAIVKVEGQEKEFAPMTITTLDPGEKEYEVSLPSYDSQKHTVNLVAGYRTTITVKLARGQLALSGDVKGATTTATTSADTTSNFLATPSSLLPLVASKSTTASTSALPKGSTIVVKKTGYVQNGEEGLRVRSGAGSDNPEIGFVISGSELKYLNESLDGWYKIEYQGKPGWVNSQYAQLK